VRASPFALCLVLLLVTAAQAADSLNVRLIGNCDTPGLAMGVAVRGDCAFVADWSSGLRVITVADPAHPTEVGHSDGPDSALALVVSGGYAYVVGMQAGLRVISVEDSTHPIEVGRYDTPGLATSVAVNGDYAYVADLDSGLWVISVTDPANPTEVGHWQESGGMTADIAVAGHFVYVVDYLHGLRVISVADPASPVEVGHNDSVGFAAVAVEGGYAYVGNNENGLFVVSLADSARPVEVGWCNTHEPVQSVAVGDYACAIGSSRLCVVSRSDPAHPDTVGHYERLGWNANGLATSGDYVYVTTDYGLSVCQRYEVGVEEATNADLRVANCEPTVIRRVLSLDGVGTRSGLSDNPVMSRAALLDISGRNVMDLRLGANDVSVLAPGVYFVSEWPGSIRKVVVAR